MTNINLNTWKVTLPIDKNGGFVESAKEIIAPKESVPPYFILNDDGTIEFSAPTDGARTSGSKYPRCELRELKPDGSLISWFVKDGGRLSAEVSVQNFPMREDGMAGRVIIGQIHGPDDELCRLYYDKGVLYFVNDKAGTSAKETTFYLLDEEGNKTDIATGERFTYTIQVLAATREIIVSAVTEGVTSESLPIVYTTKQPVGTFWTDSKGLYYKAGVYLGVSKPGSGAGVVGHGTGTVKFFALELTHGESQEKILMLENTPVATPQPTSAPTPEPTPEPTPVPTLPPKETVNVITGTNLADTIIGTDGDDRISSGRGGDYVQAGAGKNSISGGLGSDTLIGGMNDDVLSGNPDNDVLTGGGGKNIFVFEKGTGTDVITDFDVDTDTLYVKGFGVTSKDAFQNIITNAEISYTTNTGDKITVNLKTFSLNDFPGQIVFKE